jgi:putative ABC transport system permease protein
MFLTRVLSMARTRYGNAALDEELHHHMTLLTEQLVARGLSPEAATLEAQRQFGSVVRTKEAVRVLRAHPWKWLREITSSTAGVAASGRNRPSSVLVVVEIAAAMVLLVGAGLLLNSFARLARLARIDPGFEPAPLVTFKIGLPASRYPAAAAQQSFAAQLLASLRSTPGVQGVALGTDLPFQPGMLGTPLVVGDSQQEGSVKYRFIEPGFFRALGVPITRGREFTEDDRPGPATIAVVNEAFSRRYFGDTNPVGQVVRFLESGPLDIVGVVRDTKLQRLSAEAQPEISFPYQQPMSPRGGSSTLAGAIRVTGNPLSLAPLIGQAVKRLDPTLAVYGVTTMSQIVAESYAESRLLATTATVFGVIALMLAAVGLYGVLAYAVASRTREFGIKMALGADERRIIRNVIREGLTLTFLGLAIGGGGALLVSRFLAGLLFGVTPQDPATLVAVAVLFMAVGSLACYVPARRATRIDPVLALNAE